ncbi:hypothetical protein B2H94_08935 [Clostridium sporogenes]|uniref:Zinc ribbon domain-containing protein n=1 Tax=Clostridium sporogenes TaxID=1509 RepID=A0ABD6RS51_CLOSG|nr:hypothetical protein [Clostridium sporogenes]OSB19207.1 hypothetical protein B2H94_08935 [Clostridium sporogenes]
MCKNKKDISFTILENGLDFILSSIKYLSYEEDKYHIKYSILHLSSGIELIFKYKLLKEDYKYIFAKIDEADKKSFLSGNFQSVNSKECINRLKKHCNIIFSKDDTEILGTLRKKRNMMEHLTITDSTQALKSYFVRILNLGINFINNNFDTKEFSDNENELLQQIRTSLVNLEEFVTHRWSEIKGEIEDHLKYNTPIKCPSCLQKALITDDGSKCLFCGYTEESEKVADKYILKVLGIDQYETVKHGGEYPKYICSECGTDSFIHDEENEIWRCLKCGVEYSEEKVAYCTECGEPYVINKFDDVICDTCLEYKLNKD